MRTITQSFGSVFVVLTLMLIPIHPTHAQQQEQSSVAMLQEQSVVIQEKLVGFLQEYVKFLQLRFIVTLEDRVATLQRLIDQRQ